MKALALVDLIIASNSCVHRYLHKSNFSPLIETKWKCSSIVTLMSLFVCIFFMPQHHIAQTSMPINARMLNIAQTGSFDLQTKEGLSHWITNFQKLIEPSHEKTCLCICKQQRCRSACTSAQSDQHLYCSLPR